MISKHTAHSTSLPVGFRTWLWRYTCLLLLISMLWHRKAIFESKGDKWSSSAECRIRTQGLRHLLASRLNACWQTDWAFEDQATKLELDSPSLWSASIQPTRPHTTYIHACMHAYIHTHIDILWDLQNYSSGYLTQYNLMRWRYMIVKINYTDPFRKSLI